MRSRGFSLVELAIVLVIMGLIVGGIMAGSNLIRNSEVKTVITEFNQYRDAALNFRTKYSALPGDMIDASSYWASAVNGDSNGVLAWAGAANAAGEAFQFWSQMVLAGLIEGQYTGLSGSAGGAHVIVGTNAPKATLTNAGWSTWGLGVYAGDANNYAADYGNVMTIGGNTGLNSWAYAAVMKPEEVWNLDMKIDDGMPGTGKLIVTNRTICANSTSATDYASTYQLSTTSTSCSIYFAHPYD